MVSSRLLYVDWSMALCVPPSTESAPCGSCGSRAASQCASRPSTTDPWHSGSSSTGREAAVAMAPAGALTLFGGRDVSMRQDCPPSWGALADHSHAARLLVCLGWCPGPGAAENGRRKSLRCDTMSSLMLPGRVDAELRGCLPWCGPAPGGIPCSGGVHVTRVRHFWVTLRVGARCPAALRCASPACVGCGSQDGATLSGLTRRCVEE